MQKQSILLRRGPRSAFLFDKTSYRTISESRGNWVLKSKHRFEIRHAAQQNYCAAAAKTPAKF